MDNSFLNADCTFIYLDDLLIFSETSEQHLKAVLKIGIILR